jgi:hypothetical protein
VLDVHEWLGVCERLSTDEGFFHWELTFAPVFAQHGGFDLQLGNPPWVRPFWDDALVLAEVDAWFGLAHKPSVAAVKDRRTALLSLETDRYLDARSALAGVSEHLGSSVDRPLLTGLNPDLYRCFMDRTWRSMALTGVVALIHPESHFTEARAGELRRRTYYRLRRHWQFRNALGLFPEVGGPLQFGVHIYGAPRAVSFLTAASLYKPETIERSLHHDGTGSEPGIKDDDDRWDIRPHANRIIRVDDVILGHWAALVSRV